ncbi:hypothetical protein SCUCBS95973_009952 [Sporothrix curviconia]|uniref:Zinc finger PHD-type domain-containing protein n=1 Tax=Sporothrix curviconia TaxID=1260050 RepID=A0ABP0D0W9_9PEZI
MMQDDAAVRAAGAQPAQGDNDHDHTMEDAKEDDPMEDQPTGPAGPPAGATAGPAGPAAQPPSRYTNQFSAAASRAILQRLRAATRAPSSPSSAESGACETMPMPLAMPVDRDTDSDDESASDKPPRCSVCSVCARPARSVLNPLVQCARCGKRWHRLCHAPVIADYVAAAVTSATGVAVEDGVTNGVTGVDRNTRRTSSSAADESVPATETGWTCPPCTAAATAAAAARIAHRARTHNRPADALYVPPPPAPRTHNLAAHSPQQRRQYLSGLPQRELAQWLAHALETHADLAVYPPKVRPPRAPPSSMPPVPTRLPPLPGAGKDGGSSGMRLTAAQVVAAARNPAYRNGIVNSIRKSHAASVEREKERKRERERAEMEAAGIVVVAPPRRGRPPKQQPVVEALPLHEAAAETPVALHARPRPRPPVDPRHIPSFVPTPVDPEEEDPTGLMAGWPKPGKGLYAKVSADWDMQDDNDDDGDGDGDDGDEDEANNDNESGAVLVDRNDHTGFSSVVYNAVGQKVQENGLPVLRVR